MKTIEVFEMQLQLQIGSNSSENDRLFDEANDGDVWFHVSNLPSPHMWLANPDINIISNKQKLYRIALELKKNSKYKKHNMVNIVYTTKDKLRKTDTPGTLIIEGKSKYINV